jgi:NAD-dependent deacetylase
MTYEEKTAELARRMSKSHRIVAFTGAGVSTESNIPDFRSAGGVYDSISRAYGRPPEVLLSHDFFMEHTDIFYDYLRKYLIFPDAEPNDGHRVLAALERAGRLSCVVTQNIDGLHSKAGSKAVCELHGSLYRNTCMHCGRSYGLDYILGCEGVPKCKSCGGTIKPDVVLYGEQLESDVVDRAVKEIGRADMLLIMGTSLAVYPAAGLIDYFRGSELVLINKSSTPYDGRAGLVINEAAGKTLKAAAGIMGLEV